MFTDTIHSARRGRTGNRSSTRVCAVRAQTAIRWVHPRRRDARPAGAADGGGPAAALLRSAAYSNVPGSPELVVR
ncbi:hypothetical protein [Streptomyces cinerochromogenes]|uniref:hypothetical protein n=1 Tax=Streptomyces cinerochromogenes TaxID=66422 RepID=UPI0033B657EB